MIRTEVLVWGARKVGTAAGDQIREEEGPGRLRLDVDVRSNRSSKKFWSNETTIN